MVRFYIVRHGQTLLNSLDRAQGWADSPLTEAGKQKCRPLNWYNGHEQNIGKTAENKGVWHIGCCRNPLFVFEAVPGQCGSGGYGRPQWSQV